MKRLVLLLLAVALASGEAAAQAAEGGSPLARAWTRAGVTGSVRFGYWTSSRDLDDERHRPSGTLWLKATPERWRGLAFVFEGWAQAREGRGSGNRVGVRDAFVGASVGPLDVRIGRQVIAWGRADGINPTDTLTPRDFTVLAHDEADERLGAAAVKATWYGDGLSVTGVWLPEFLPHTVPLPIPSEALAIRPAERPRRRWALRVDRTGGALDWSASYYEGPDLFPDLGVAASAAAVSPVLTLSYPLIRVLGGDAVAVVGRFVLRAEAAYTDTPDGDGADPFVRNPFVLVVAGGERTFGEYFNVNLQYVGRFVRRHGPPREALDPPRLAVARQHAVLTGQVSAVQHGMTARLAHRWRRETMEAEVAAAGFAGPDGYLVRPKIAWAVTDRWKLTAGGEWADGEAASFYRLLRRNASVYTELRWSF